MFAMFSLRFVDVRRVHTTCGTATKTKSTEMKTLYELKAKKIEEHQGSPLSLFKVSTMKTPPSVHITQYEPLDQVVDGDISQNPSSGSHLHLNL